ncbi:MAG: TonB-dependent receptor [Candidatus Rokubacteria bacterium]|nr:TonB-dependent receptor [Candidatus Rokubacteria bacterium]
MFGSEYTSGGNVDNSDSSQRAFGGQAGVTLPFGIRVSLLGRYAKTDNDIPLDTAVPLILDPDSQQQSEFSTLTLALEQQAFAWWQHRLALHGTWNNLGFQDPFTPGVDSGALRSQFDTSRKEVEWVHAFKFVPWNTLTAGVEYRGERGENVSSFVVGADVFPTRFDKEVWSTALFLQDDVVILDRLVLSGGVRYDASSAHADIVTPRASAALLIRETGSKIRGGWGQGFRAPTINDLFFPGASNPDLGPERSTSWEVGADQRLWGGRVRLGATYFNTIFRNLIQFDLVQFIPVNVGRAKAQGVEGTVEVDVLPWLVVTGNVTYTATEDIDTGDPLRRIAPWTGSLAVTAEPRKGLNLFTQIFLTSSQFEGRDLSGDRITNPGYVRVDLGGSYRIFDRRGARPALDFYARLQNLLNQSYAEVKGFQALGLNAIVGLKASY